MGNLCKYVNDPMELLYLSLPCLVSLALCPMTLYLYQPLVDAFWWDDSLNMVVLPNVNEAILCFLMPAGVVYATSFGFAIETAVAKQGERCYYLRSSFVVFYVEFHCTDLLKSDISG